jgi:DnaJ-class molecular chaperone
MKQTHYSTLGIDRSATAEEVKAAWRALSSQLHPDRLGGTPEANAAFAEVTAAYAVIADKKRRAQYNAGLDLMTKACAGCKGAGRTWKQKGFTARLAMCCKACGGCGRI